MESYLGLVYTFAIGYLPREFLPCDGRSLPVMKYQALYALLGGRYGGDGHTSFNLPDLRGKEPHPAMQFGICVDGLFPARPD